MAGTEALVITEKWIRDKLNLKMESLESVRSLSLPGTHYYKITHLGRSLVSFSHLKHLDLSRNALESLEGIDHLKHLETINVYYNLIPNLKEVFRLRHNTKLKKIDLRLNPVTQLVPDYRLFVVHMLLHLRVLDNRAVTDEERKVALMHFDTDQANEFDKVVRERDKENLTPGNRSEKINNPVEERVNLIKSVASSHSLLGADTEELLQLFAEKDDINPKRKILKAIPPSLKKKRHLDKKSFTPPANKDRQPGVNFTPHPALRDKHINEHQSKEAVLIDDSVTMETAQTLNEAEKKLKETDETLHQTLQSSDKKCEDMKQLLSLAHKDMNNLNGHYQTLLQEKSTLKANGCGGMSTGSDLVQKLDDVMQQQKSLVSSMEHLSHNVSQLLEHSVQLQNVVVMLQDTHKSLMSNNHHLLEEITDIKKQHSLEIMQLSANYDSLRSLVHNKLHL